MEKKLFESAEVEIIRVNDIVVTSDGFGDPGEDDYDI